MDITVLPYTGRLNRRIYGLVDGVALADANCVAGVGGLSVITKVKDFGRGGNYELRLDLTPDDIEHLYKLTQSSRGKSAKKV